MASDLEDLLDFLVDKRVEIRQEAVNIVQGLTGSVDGLEQLRGAHHDKLLLNLLRLVTDPQPSISRAALTALVNLSQAPGDAGKLLQLNVVGRMMDYIREKSCPHVRLMVMLLANVTATEPGSESMLQLGQGRLEGLHMAVLLKHYVVSAVTLLPEQQDPWEHVAGVLMNVTRLKQGRALLLQPGRGLLQALVSQLQARSLVRRRGSSGALKNCCMAAAADGMLKEILVDEQVIAKLLVPINGQEPKEADDTVREFLAEAVLALAETAEGREVLWRVGAPDILKKGYEHEECPGVCLAMEHTARIFIQHSTLTDSVEAAGQTPLPPPAVHEETESNDKHFEGVGAL